MNLISQLKLVFWHPAIICRTICCNVLKSCVFAQCLCVCLTLTKNIVHYYQQHQELVRVIQNGCVLCEVRSWGLSPRRPRSMEVPDPEVRSNRGFRLDLRIWIGCSHRADLHVGSMPASHAGSSMRYRPRSLMATCDLQSFRFVLLVPVV